ncbi:hypothetical protein AGABI2DRAFT_193379 [Agaricus bisporus var. bisporus H97]|uniref:hypothetical protein n=1 Tax=Agaricus bisporus var. bisporus (strain H97 / ATCC MYA-4626 / FGSC 10389) TaxID=936046 RepID=UPI00029F6565|nr:hypothetical protein AGABI2DRAFT_193379 [Agaricus bisporus var. bisporus H97]EKV46753.1 hypothetical protein AGABI2DRAFT_193379 [Agaricus bisporus var. bisporus H97]
MRAKTGPRRRRNPGNNVQAIALPDDTISRLPARFPQTVQYQDSASHEKKSSFTT